MTYRSDHDAALARVEALEVENARLADENAKLRMRHYTPPPPEPEEKRTPYHMRRLPEERTAASYVLSFVVLILMLGVRACIA